jgi:hypothetical protein
MAIKVAGVEVVSDSRDLTIDGGTVKLNGNYPVGTNNVAMGGAALSANTSGGYNVALGMNSLASNTTATNNTAVGYATLNNSTTTQLLAIKLVSHRQHRTTILL